MPRKNARSARSDLNPAAPRELAPSGGQESPTAGRTPGASESGQSYALEAEWLEADGLGGFASGSVGTVRTRRDQALLLVATAAPPRRVALVNGFDAWVETPGGTFHLTSQRYAPGVVYPDGALRIESFSPEPWPQWSYALEDGTRIEHEIFASYEHPLVALAWRLLEPRDHIKLFVRPFLSGREDSALHRENDAFRFAAEPHGRCVRFSTYPGIPDIFMMSNAEYRHAPEWYRNFLYSGEAERGSGALEDLAAPGVLVWDLSALEAVLVLASQEKAFEGHLRARAAFRSLRAVESARRRHFRSPLHRAADAYLVRQQRGRALVPSYPWTRERVADSFGALRGLCLARGNLEAAQEILLDWAGEVSDGMLPDRLPARGETPEFTSVDGSLWYIVAVHEFLQALARSRRTLQHELENRLWTAVQAILTGYTDGTRLGIQADAQGLLDVGKNIGMGTKPVTPAGTTPARGRSAKRVELQALWLNALWVGGKVAERWQRLFERGLVSFRERFWSRESGCLRDWIDVDSVGGSADARTGPYQIFAVGGLPRVLLDPGQARQVVEVVEAQFWTPLGLRCPALPRGDGDADEGAAPSGVCSSIAPKLATAFVEAWVRVRGETHQAKVQARERFLDGILQHLHEGGIGHVSERADAEPPHALQGSPFHAWSLGELLRLQEVVLDVRPNQPTGPSPERPKSGHISPGSRLDGGA